MAGARIPINTTGSLHKLMFKHYVEAKSASGAGQKVAWVTSGAPVELLRAAGIVPVYPENHAALCGAQKRGAHYCALAEARGFGPDLCSYARTDLGCVFANDSPIGGLPRPDLLLCCNNICGTVVKWYEELARLFDVPLVLIDTPFLHGAIEEHAVRYVRAQLEDATATIEKVAGTPLEPERLYETLVLSARATERWREILGLCAHKPSPMTSFDAFSHMAPIVTLRGTQECVDYYEMLLSEMRQRVEANVEAVPGERYRLGWDNIPIWFKLGALAKRFAQHGACLVIATYTDAWAMSITLDAPDGLLAELARVYTAVYINSGIERRIEVLLGMVKKYGLDGLVMHSNRSCKAYSLGQYDTARILQEKHGVPCLIIEGDMNDSRVYAEEPVNNRIDAFMEHLASSAASERQS